MPNYRVGVGARLESHAKPIFFIEIIASPYADHHAVNLNSLENSLLVLRKLKERGYVLTCEEDGAVSCELAVPSENLTLEYEAAISIIKKYME
jgi:DNA-binding IclR family transcriptional regulator